ncbi:MAG: leucine-rich repeat domain-containing protein [Paludibacteraceae bacterium]|nr:leucine-rich repeat domain-containing protein [Paludibacteraceae bacterium]
MNCITKYLSIVLFALLQATAFAYEVGDTITEYGVKYFVVEKHYVGRWQYDVTKKNVCDYGANVYGGQVLAIGADGVTKNICVAKELRYVSKRNPNDSVPIVEQFFVMGINDNAFANEEFETINIPEGLDYIADGAFQNTKITSGSLWLPYAYRLGEGVFTGLKADLVFFEMKIANTLLNHTFEPIDSLPTIIAPSLSLKMFRNENGWPADKILGYGSKILSEKHSRECREISKCGPVIGLSETKKYGSYQLRLNNASTTHTFFTSSSNGVLITVKKIKLGKKEKNPYAVYNDARNQYSIPFFYYYKDISSPSFIMNDMFFRLENKDQYVYFTLDGKKVDIDVVADKDGFDPFGTRIVSEEEIQKRKAKEININKLDKKADDLMKRFGF